MNIQLDGHKLLYHPNEVSKWVNNELFAPVYVEIGVTSACNHRCSFCAFDYLGERNDSIEKSVLMDNIRDMAAFGVKSIMFGGEGEPLVYPHLTEAIEEGKKQGLDIAITSNGVLFTEEKCKNVLKNLAWIKFSVDSGTAENYAKMHGTVPEDFSKLLANMKFAAKYKRENSITSAIGCQMVVVDENINEVEKLILQIKDFGLDYLVLKPYVKHPESINDKTLSMADYDKVLSELVKKYEKDLKIIFRGLSFSEIEKNALDYEHCYGVNFMGLIDAKGNVIPCSVFYEKPEFYYGNINTQKFSEIWASKRRLEIVEKVLKKGCENCRNNCRLNFVNKYLSDVKHRSKTHINFI
jgi:GTP 3',8-cyclase